MVEPEAYFALSWAFDDPTRPFVVVARGAGTPESLTSTVRSAVLLALVALIACYVPVRRAMCVDPVLALRYE